MCILRECLVTLDAMVSFLSSVYSHMPYKTTIILNDLLHWLHWYGFSPVWILIWDIRFQFFQKYIATLAALIWFLPSVTPHMYFTFTIMWECLVTLVALVWFLSSVCPHMAYRTAIILECLVTLAALIWFLSSVCSHMHYKITVIWECLASSLL